MIILFFVQCTPKHYLIFMVGSVVPYSAGTLVDIYHQPGGFQENILTVLSTFFLKNPETNNTSFESPDIGKIGVSLKKCLTALLGYFFHSKNPSTVFV